MEQQPELNQQITMEELGNEIKEIGHVIKKVFEIMCKSSNYKIINFVNTILFKIGCDRDYFNENMDELIGLLIQDWIPDPTHNLQFLLYIPYKTLRLINIITLFFHYEGIIKLDRYMDFFINNIDQKKEDEILLVLNNI
jgi:hypothetical protein